MIKVKEVKEILTKMDNDCVSKHGLHWFQIEHYTQQICQLFPQPRDMTTREKEESDVFVKKQIEPKPYCDKQPMGLPLGCIDVGFCSTCEFQPKPDEGRLLTVKDIAEEICNQHCEKLQYCGDLASHPYRECPYNKPLRSAIRLVTKTASIKDAECQKKVEQVTNYLDLLLKHNPLRSTSLRRELGKYIQVLKKKELRGKVGEPA